MSRSHNLARVVLTNDQADLVYIFRYMCENKNKMFKSKKEASIKRIYADKNLKNNEQAISKQHKLPFNRHSNENIEIATTTLMFNNYQEFLCFMFCRIR